MLFVRDAATSKVIWQTEGHNYLASVAWSPDGSYILTGQGLMNIGGDNPDSHAKIWNATTGTLVRTLEGHTARVTSVSWGLDGKTVATASFDGTVRIWDTQDGQLLQNRQLDAPIYGIAWHPNKPELLTVGGGWGVTIAEVWNSSTGTVTANTSGHRRQVTSVAWHPDNHSIVSASDDKTLLLWNAATGQQTRTFTGHEHAVSAAAFSLDGRYLVSGDRGNNLIIWNVETTKPVQILHGHSHPITSVAWSPVNNFIATSDYGGTIKIWSADTGALINSFRAHLEGVSDIEWSPSGDILATAGHGLYDQANPVKLWHTSTWSLQGSLQGLTGPVLSLSWNPEGTSLVAGGYTGHFAIWDAKTHALLLKQAGSAAQSIASLAWSPDGGRILAGRSFDALTIWSVISGEELYNFHESTGYRITTVAWAPDGSTFTAVGGDSLNSGDFNTVGVWKLRAVTP